MCIRDSLCARLDVALAQRATDILVSAAPPVAHPKEATDQRNVWRESAGRTKLLRLERGWGGPLRRPWGGSEGCKKARRARADSSYVELRGA
eukprot:5488447-Prymnesium_polylepis.1